MTSNSLICWIVTEGLKGTENQCLGVAEALGVEPVVKQISLKQPWKLLSPYIGFENNYIFNPGFEAPWPDLLITSGRKSIAVARYIKKASKGKTFTAHIQDPRVSPAQFDLVAVPEHDPTRGENVITTLGAPNRITEDKLDDAREAFHQLKEVSKPRVAVLIGGNSKAHTMSTDAMEHLCAQLKSLDAGLMITASRRTGEENQATLKRKLSGSDAYIWNGEGKNPYFALLAWADYILVTEDSVSMTCDAATTGKPVYVIPMEGGAPRLNAFHRNMKAVGITRVFDGNLERWDYEPLRDAQKIAQAIKSYMQG